jgi:hypothetical protein
MRITCSLRHPVTARMLPQFCLGLSFVTLLLITIALVVVCLLFALLCFLHLITPTVPTFGCSALQRVQYVDELRSPNPTAMRAFCLPVASCCAWCVHAICKDCMCTSLSVFLLILPRCYLLRHLSLLLIVHRSNIFTVVSF